MNIWSGEKEARLNIPMEGEEGAVDGILEIPPDQLSTEQSILVVPQSDEADPKPPIPKGAPAYEAAGKISPPSPSAGDEAVAFQQAMITVQKEGGAFDSALDDLRELSHDIFYGLEIVKDGPLLEKLVCLTLGYGSQSMPAKENGRDHKAANILASAIQNNPSALKRVAGYSKAVIYPSCGQAGAGAEAANFVTMFRSRLGHEEDAGALKAKVSAISGLLKEPSIRDSFIVKRGMDLLLAVFLKPGAEYDGVRKKVAQLVMDNFLDEDMGAQLGVWPKEGMADAEACESPDGRLADGCWEHHVAPHRKQGWGKDFLEALRGGRARAGGKARKGEL